MRAPEVIYELVAREAAKVAGVDSGAVVRFRVDGVAEVVGSWHTPGQSGWEPAPTGRRGGSGDRVPHGTLRPDK